MANLNTHGSYHVMLPQSQILSVFLPALGLSLCIACSSSVMGQDAQTTPAYDVVNPPPCTNNKGETVLFIDSDTGRPGVAAGMANRDKNGKPVVLRSNYAATPPEFQSFIDRHECAHHQTGDIDRPHPPRNSPEHLMNESISDCIAILRLRDEEKYDRAAFDSVAAAMRKEMANIGFPEISISSRISNISNCYAKYGSTKDFVNGILKQRGLLEP